MSCRPVASRVCRSEFAPNPMPQRSTVQDQPNRHCVAALPQAGLSLVRRKVSPCPKTTFCPPRGPKSPMPTPSAGHWGQGSGSTCWSATSRRRHDSRPRCWTPWSPTGTATSRSCGPPKRPVELSGCCTATAATATIRSAALPKPPKDAAPGLNCASMAAIPIRLRRWRGRSAAWFWLLLPTSRTGCARPARGARGLYSGPGGLLLGANDGKGRSGRRRFTAF